MGRRRAKNKARSPGEETSEELMEVRCGHVRKGVEHSWLRKTGPDQNWDSCQGCEQEGDRPPGDPGGPIWTCLKCGHRGCGRFSDQKHAVKHYETAHSEPHCLVLSVQNWSVWCYICDEEIQYSSTGRLAQLISNIKRQLQEGPGHGRELKGEENAASHAPEESAAPKEPEPKEEPKDSVEKGVAPSGRGECVGAVPVRGLSNLGNTCFFNAVVQNLSQTWMLRRLLCGLRDEERCEVITPPPAVQLDPLRVRLSRPGPLSLAMCQLLNEIQECKRSVVTPRDLFTQVCKKAARFKGFQQQDSQELLRYLLDGMRNEENSRVSAGVSEALKGSGESSAVLQAKLLRGYESCVERVFGGEMTSTVVCKACQTVSVVTESFLDLSLPVVDEAYRKKKAAPQRGGEGGGGGHGPEPPDVAEGAGSKYQQKKAKKQAKKQAKSQRRQQKLGAVETGDVGGADEPGSQSEPVETNHHKPAGDQEEREEETSPAPNRFSGLSEDGVDGERGDSEEAELSLKVRRLSLSSEETQNGRAESIERAESEAEPQPEFVKVNVDPEQAFSSLASRAAPSSSACSVESSLHQFTQVEELRDCNSLLCVTCSHTQGGKKKIYREALKQMLISSPPPVLTLHLKRFQQVAYSVCKVNRHVQFPQVLDLAPFCSIHCKGVEQDQTQVLYSLYGVVEHSGTMRSGHYTAFVKSRPHGGAMDPREVAPPTGAWFHVSDSSVTAVPESRVLNSQAYLLFYERISHTCSPSHGPT